MLKSLRQLSQTSKLLPLNDMPPLGGVPGPGMSLGASAQLLAAFERLGAAEGLAAGSAERAALLVGGAADRARSPKAQLAQLAERSTFGWRLSVRVLTKIPHLISIVFVACLFIFLLG